MSGGENMVGAGKRLEHAKVWALAGPIILSNLSVPLLGAVDTAVVGHLPDPAALGAVGLGATIFSFVYWGFGFLRMSTTGLVAQAWGRNDDRESMAILVRAMLLASTIAAAVMILQIPIIHGSLWIIDSSPRVEQLTEAYFSIRIWSAPAALGVFVLLGWFLGQQDARTPLILQILMNGVNIGLDLWFVMGFGWGVEGVAAATVIAEYAGFAVGLIAMLRMRRAPLPKISGLLDRQAMMTLLAVNRDIFIRTLCLLGGLTLFTVKSAEQGELVLAVNTLLLNFLSFASHGLDAFAHAAEAMVGGAVGRGDREAFKAAVRTVFLWGTAVAVAVTAVFLVSSHGIVGLLTDIPEVLDAADTYVIWAVLIPLFSFAAFVFDGIFIGATRGADLRNAMVMSTIVYLVVLYAVEDALGNHGLWLALTVFMALRGGTLAVFYPRLVRSVGVEKTSGA